MPLIFPSAQWVEALRKAINNDPLFCEKGKDWTHGGLALVIEPNASAGLASEKALLLALENGTCREALFMDANKAREMAAIVIEGGYDLWIEILRGDLDPTKALMQMKLRVTKGSLPTVIKQVPAIKQIFVNASRINTTH